MSLQALMALLGHVTTEMTLRYASLAAPAVRTAYEEAMGKARTRLTLAIAPAGQPIIPDRIKWLNSEDPAGLFGQAVRVKSSRARWLDLVRSRGWPVQ